MTSDYQVLLDYGHGALDHTGHYHSIAAGKLFRHKDSTAYEGELNRALGAEVEQQLDKLGISYIVISDDILDLQLKDRVRKANTYYTRNQKSFLISLHCNASPRHNARGYEVYTSPGDTESDQLAEYHYHFTAALLDDRIKMRSDKFSDGDQDKEANFTILTATLCPAILVEHLFFDQIDDYNLLQSKLIRRRFGQATAYACQAFIEYLDAKEWS